MMAAGWFWSFSIHSNCGGRSPLLGRKDRSGAGRFSMRRWALRSWGLRPLPAPVIFDLTER
jgi:hypothetical protein